MHDARERVGGFDHVRVAAEHTQARVVTAHDERFLATSQMKLAQLSAFEKHFTKSTWRFIQRRDVEAAQHYGIRENKYQLSLRMLADAD